jgi:Domain of unknown function (DUF4376)
MILRNGQPFNIDAGWTDENGFQYPANWYRLATDEERAEKGFSWVDDPPSFDERYYYDANTPKPLDQIQQRVKNDLSAIRWGRQSQGIIWNNSVFATDDASKVNYLAALLQAQTNPNYTVIWKAREVTEFDIGAAKFVTLNATDITTITNAGVDYITKCFENEKVLLEAIDAATDLDGVLAIDIRSGWPTREY